MVALVLVGVDLGEGRDRVIERLRGTAQAPSATLPWPAGTGDRSNRVRAAGSPSSVSPRSPRRRPCGRGRHSESAPVGRRRSPCTLSRYDSNILRALSSSRVAPSGRRGRRSARSVERPPGSAPRRCPTRPASRTRWQAITNASTAASSRSCRRRLSRRQRSARGGRRGHYAANARCLARWNSSSLRIPRSLRTSSSATSSSGDGLALVIGWLLVLARWTSSSVSMPRVPEVLDVRDERPLL